MIEFSLSIGCPVLCQQCPQDKIQSAYHGPRLMSFADFTAILEKLPAGVDVSFAGFAEPYLNPNCTAMIQAAHCRGHPVLLYTTCVGMRMSDALELSEIPFKILCLHLPDHDGNAKIHVTDAYLAIVDAMAEAHPKAQMMQLGNIHPAMEKYRSRIKATYIHTRAGNVVNKLTGTVRLKQRGPLRCTQSEKIEDNVILPDGTATLCCSDWNLEHPLGNLLDQTWEAICEGAAKERMRGLMKDGPCLCRQCEFAQPA